MPEFERLASEFRAVADVDFFDVSFIAESLREDLDLRDQKDIRPYTLRMIRRLMELGVCPGDYDYARTISFWPGEPDELVKRIEAEWIAMGKTPDLENPICWFGLRQN